MRPIAVTLGDPAGIGPEITTKAWERRNVEGLPPFFAVGAPDGIEAVWDGPIVRIAAPEETADAFRKGLPLFPLADCDGGNPGTPNLEGARCSFDALELAAGLARSGAASALVTGPVSKVQLHAVGFRHPGQTEFIAERCGISPSNAIMLLAGPSLKVVPMTAHIPLREVPDALTIELVVARGIGAAKGLKRNFGIDKPRLAFAGINPHAGEGGALGREEIDILVPAIAQLCELGIDARGPFAADAMFHERARRDYDVAMCGYHDQALIPLKTLHFDEGVNMTLGLPFVRTSPDHGTAFGIAGRDEAEPGAMIAAIRMAAAAAKQRELACR